MVIYKKRKFNNEARGYQLIFGYLGIFIVVVGIFCLFPLFMLFFFKEEAQYFYMFLIPGASEILLGLILYFALIFKREKAQLEKHQDSTLLLLVWVFAILGSSMPFIFRGMTFTDSIFETTSAYSSTGLTVFDFDPSLPAPHMFIFHRTITMLLGGIGLVLVVTSAISDRYGLKLYTAEGHNDKLMPNLVKSARLILGIYVGYTFLGTFLLWLVGGMTFFDAFCSSASCLATGGFSSRAGGLYEIVNIDYGSGVTNELGFMVNPIACEVITMVLMILGATNFLIHLFIFTGKWKKVFKDCEFKFLALASIIFVPLFFASVLLSNDIGLAPSTSFRYGIYHFVSAITTTGFSNAPSMFSLGNVTLALIIVVCHFGGGMGSTAGGIKQYRMVVAIKSLYWSIKERGSSRRFLYPHTVSRLGERKEITKDETSDCYNYILLYIALVFFSSLAIALIAKGQNLEINGSSITFSDALFEYSNGISSNGMSNGISALRNPAINWIIIFGMFAGRLEIYPIFFGIKRISRDILRKETI